MIIAENTLNTTAIFSEDKKYRYLLKKEWDKSKPNAAVIMLNPSKANELKFDKTVMNVMNYLFDNDYGSMTIVNLYSYMATIPKELKNKDLNFEKHTDNYINEAATKGNIIIIAWTKNDYITRKREVEKLLIPYKSKLKCFMDTQNRKPRHPRDLSSEWNLVDYDFMYTK